MPQTAEAVTAPELRRDPSRHAPRPRKPRPCATVELLDVRQVCSTCTISPTTLARLVKRGEFPRPLRFAMRVVRWRAADVREFIRALPAA